MRNEWEDQEKADRGGKPTGLHRAVVSKGNGSGQKLAREQKRREKIKKERSRRRSTKARETEPTTTPSVAEEATIVLAGNNKTCSNGRS